MTGHRLRRAAALLLAGALAMPWAAAAQSGRGRGGTPPWDQRGPALGSDNARRDSRGASRTVRRYQEPASARGYADGYQHGWNDGHQRYRYDPAGHRDYRDADHGFSREYGSRDAYRNNYRAGFRPGYEEGYRDGLRSRR